MRHRVAGIGASEALAAHESIRAAQYTGYTRFNGIRTNYYRGGRKASANNSIYLIALFTLRENRCTCEVNKP